MSLLEKLCNEILIDEVMLIEVLLALFQVLLLSNSQHLQLSAVRNLMHHTLFVQFIHIHQVYLPTTIAGIVLSRIRYLFQFQRKGHVGKSIIPLELPKNC